MSIVLSILEILGWCLLVLLLLVILLLAIFLFCPIRYKLEGVWLEEKWAKFNVHWLWRLIRAKASYEDDLVYIEAHVFWKKFTFSFDLSKKEDFEFVEETEEQVESQDEETEDVKSVLAAPQSDKKVVGTESAAELRGETATETITETVDEPVVDEQQETSEEDIFEEEQESIVSKIKGILERIKEIYAKVKKILADEKNQDAIKHIKNELFYMIKVFLPKKSKVDLVFSTGSPDTTGQLFGALALFPAMYQKNWKILPDFQADDPYFKGTFWGKGKFYVCQFVGIMLRIVFDKNCRRLYTILNKFMESLKNEKSQEEK